MESRGGASDAPGTSAFRAPRVDGSIVVLEDDEILRPLLVSLLEAEGLEVVSTADGAEALELLAVSGAGLLILDANVSSPSGSELLRRLRRRQLRPRILGLIMPGQSGLRRIHRALGVEEFIAEPFDPSELVRRARALLGEAVGAASGGAR